ncbi:MAG: thioredoxin family protein [Fimbriimonadales bacterium]|nr:thioredoxin family protein [Fimbriimonadales bacterium]
MVRGAIVGMVLAAACLAPAQTRWASGLEAGLQEARRSGRLVLALFVAEGCSWCQRLERETLADPRVEQELKALVPVRLEAPKQGSEAVRRYRVQGFPTAVLLNARGEAEASLLGFRPPAEFLEALRQAVADAKARPALEARIAKDPKDADALLRLAAAAARSGNLSRARQMVDRAEESDPQDRFRRLARTLCLVGDAFQAAMRYEDAIGFFQRALKHARSPEEAGYARLSIAACRISRGEDAAARRELQEALSLPNLSERDRRAAEAMLRSLSERNR